MNKLEQMKNEQAKKYMRGVLSECGGNPTSFIDWLVNVNHFSEDGWVITNLKKCVNSKEKLSEFFERFNLLYKNNRDMLTQCSIDLIDRYKQVVD